MANPNVPRGLVHARGVNSQYSTGGLRAYVHASTDATPLYQGDPFTLTGTNYTVNGMSLPGVTRAATSHIIAGFVVGSVPDSRACLPSAAASTDRDLLAGEP